MAHWHITQARNDKLIVNRLTAITNKLSKLCENDGLELEHIKIMNDIYEQLQVIKNYYTNN